MAVTTDGASIKNMLSFLSLMLFVFVGLPFTLRSLQSNTSPLRNSFRSHSVYSSSKIANFALLSKLELLELRPSPPSNNLSPLVIPPVVEKHFDTQSHGIPNSYNQVYPPNSVSKKVTTSYSWSPDSSLREQLKWDVYLHDRVSLVSCQLHLIESDKTPMPERFPNNERRYIMYSLFGNARRYKKRLEKRLLEARMIFRGWRVRVFVPQGFMKEYEFLRFLRQKYFPLLEIIEVHDISDSGDACPLPMFWRFVFNDQPEVDRAISRDLDSELLIRDKHAVDEWIDSGKLLHVMRDSPKGHDFPINGGMFGVRRNVVKKRGGWRELVKEKKFLGKEESSQSKW